MAISIVAAILFIIIAVVLALIGIGIGVLPFGADIEPIINLI